jgi:mitochondrial splicing suppressor protein 51
MALSRSFHRRAVLVASRAHIQQCQPNHSVRTIFSWFRQSGPAPPGNDKTKPTEPILTEDNLFHPFSQSPFPALRARGEAIQTLAPCPVCASHHHGVHAHTQAQPKAVKFECPDCGWPTHCTEEHWQEDEEHQKYCSRLREVNEDEHDLRSGRRLREFELPGMDSLC